MLHKSTKIIAVVATVFFLASSIVCTIFVTMVNREKAEYRELTVTRLTQVSEKASLQKLMETFEESSEIRTSLLSRVIKDEDIITLLARIEAMGREQGVTLTTNSLTVEPIDSTFETLVIDINVSGTHAGVLHLLKLLEHLPYQVRITSVQMNQGEGEDAGVWSSTLKIRITKFTKV